MKKLQYRLILMIVIGILFATCIGGAASLLNFISVGEERSISILNKELKLSASYINETFADVEKFTNTLSDYYLKNCPDQSLLAGSEGKRYLDICKELALTMIKDNEMMCATYFRLNPELGDFKGTGGFFLSATSENHSVTEQPPTDISAYDKDDISHVGWYYVPVEAGKPIWMDEYFNENNGILMISYVAPLYLDDGTLLGVVGIDIEMDKVYNHFSSVRLYDTGIEAIMSDSGEIKKAAKNINITDEDKAKILNSDDGVQLTYLDKQKKATLLSERLINGDYLLLTIQNDDLYITENRMIMSVIIITVLVCSVVILVLIKMLSQVFNKYKTDELTKVENRNVYLDLVDEINRTIESGRETPFIVLVFDVNCLKQTNDILGHDAGDKLLKDAANTIRSFFPDVLTFRVGGDEFVVCLRRVAQNAISYHFEKFRAYMAEQAQGYQLTSGKVVLSSGMATYDAKTDHCFDDVFRRADQDMFADKRKFYQVNAHLNTRDNALVQSYKQDKEGMLQLLTVVQQTYDMIISVNLTQNTYRLLSKETFLTHGDQITGKFDEIIDIHYAKVVDEHKELYYNTFSREALLKAYEEGKDSVYLQYQQIDDDGVPHWLGTHTMFTKNPDSDDVTEITISRNIDKAE